MAIEHEMIATGQPLLQNGKMRGLKVVFDEPNTGINEDTGMLVLIGGYGSKLTSNIYVKMRSLFADCYNMITLQCDFFGYEYMSPDCSKLNVPFQETEDSYHEMGPMQAMDHLIAIKSIMKIIEVNKMAFNKNKIIFYGHSHGAYLSYLCNAFAPKLISAIIDNSAYLFPYYITHDRTVKHTLSQTNQVQVELSHKFHYLVSDLDIDRQIYDLQYLYQRIKNNTKILSYHGSEDTMIPYEDKRKFIQTIDHAILHQVTPEQVDGRIFHSAIHSLDMDFVYFFDHVYHKYHLGEGSELERGIFSEVSYRTEKYKYKVILRNEFPVMVRENYSSR